MDLFKRIKDLSAIFDDDGPSAVDQESRPMFANGQLVQPNADGSRPGYAGDDFINLNDIKKYNKNLLDKSIFVSTAPGKTGANQAAPVTLRNIFNVVEKTQGGDVLINNFKKNPTNENFLKLRKRRKNRIAFEREQALPAEQKEEIRKKDRIAEKKWRASGKGQSYYNELLAKDGIFPARTAQERVWRDIYRASKQSKEDSRFKIKYPKNIEIDPETNLPKKVKAKSGKYYIPWDRYYKKVSFYDTKTKSTIKFGNMREWMKNNVKGGGKKYDNAIQNYNIRQNIADFDVDGKSLGAVAKEKKTGLYAKKLTTPAAVNHRSGLNNFWDTEITTSTGNAQLNDKVQSKISAYKNASNPNIKNKILKQMKAEINKIKGGATLVVDGQTIGKKPTLRKVSNALANELNVNLLKLAGQIDPDCKQAIADGGRIGLKTIGSPDVCITKARNYMNEELIKGIGTQQNAKTSLIKRILAGSANFLKQNLSPKELFKMENLIGKPALYGAAAFETGLVADDVLRKGKPLNVSAAESLFGSVLNLDADAARAKNLLESNTQLSPAAKEYAQNILDYDKYRKLDLSFPSSLVAKSMPGSGKYFKMQEDLRKKIESTPDTGAFDYQSALDESEGAFKAKPKKLFGLEIDSPDAPEVTPLTNKFALPASAGLGRTRTGPMTAKQDMKIDLTPITYQNFEPNIPPKKDFDDYLRNKNLIEKDQELTEGEYQRSFYKPAEFEQLMKLPSFRGTQFAGGGIAKIAGDRSGAMTRSMNPDSQGLSYLFNRVKKI